MATGQNVTEVDSTFRAEFGDNRDDAAREIAQLWAKWHSAKSGHRRDTRMVKEYLSAVDTSTTENARMDGGHSTTIPLLVDIKRTQMALYISALFSNPDWAKFGASTGIAEDISIKNKLEEYVKLTHRSTSFEEEAEKLVNDYLDDGNMYAQVVPYEKVNPRNPLDKSFSGGKMVRINPRNIAFNDKATSFEESGKIIREVMTIGDVAKRMVTGKVTDSAKSVLDKALKFRRYATTNEDWDLDRGDEYEFGSWSSYLNGDLVEILTFYGDLYIPKSDGSLGEVMQSTKIVVIDRRWVVEQTDIDTWSGSPLIFHKGWESRSEGLMSSSLFSSVTGIQYKINHLENRKSDLMDSIVDSDRVIDGNYTTEVGYDGKTEWVDQTGMGKGVGYITHPVDVLNNDFQIDRLINFARAATGTPSELSGFRSQGEKTKFEVSKLDENSLRVLTTKIYKASDFFGEIVNAQIEVAAKNPPVGLALTVTSDLGIPEFPTITRSDFEATGRFYSVGAKAFERQAVLAQTLSEFQRAMQMDGEMAQHISPKRMSKLWEEYLSYTAIEGLFSDNVRIVERLESQQVEAAAQQTLIEEARAEQQILGTEEEIINGG